MAKAETIAWELSEPGTGIPIPVYDDPNKDKAIKGGWRLDTPPPQPNSNGGS